MPEFKYDSYGYKQGQIEGKLEEVGFVLADTLSEASYKVFRTFFFRDFDFAVKRNFTFEDHFSYEWFLTMKENLDESVVKLGTFSNGDSYLDFGEPSSAECICRLTYFTASNPSPGCVTEKIQYEGFSWFTSPSIASIENRALFVSPWEPNERLSRLLLEKSKEDLILLIHKLKEIGTYQDSPVIDMLNTL